MDAVGPNGAEAEARLRASFRAADVRVRVALRSIEQAQRLLDQACQALSSVNGMLIEWQKVGKACDQAKVSWHAVQRKAERLGRQGRLALHHEPGPYEAHWTRLLEGDPRADR